MAKHTENEEIIDVQEAITSTEKFLDKNKNLLIGGTIGLVALVGGSMYYSNSYIPSKNAEAKELMFKAQSDFERDSFNLAMYGDGINVGFEAIANDYGSTPAGNSAKYYMGISLMRTGDFEGAIDYLKSFSKNDKMVSAMALGAIGDCYLELGQSSDAISFYKKAAAQSGDDLTAPYYLGKAGQTAMNTSDVNQAAKIYTELKDKYPTSDEGRYAEKYLGEIDMTK